MATLPSITDTYPFNMSVYVNEAIKMCRSEEAALTETVRQCKDILQSISTLANSGTDESMSTDVEDDIPMKEQQEIELLEQVLKKALKVRSSSAVSRDLQGEKNPAMGDISQSKVAIKNNARDANEVKPHKSSSPIQMQVRCHQRGGSLKSIALHCPVHTQPVLVKRPPLGQPSVRRQQLSTKPGPVQTLGVSVQKKSFQPVAHSEDPYKKKIIVPPTFKDKELRTRSQVSPLKEQRESSHLLPEWKAERIKKNNLWSKVFSQHTKPVPERANFIERLRSTFQISCPPSQAAAGETELDTLTQLGLDLTHCYHAVLQSHQLLFAHMPSKDPETSLKREYESLLMLKGLERMMAEIIKHANHLKKEWDRKAGGSLCPLQKKGKWGDPKQSCLPPVLYYRTEAELEELDTLRLRVDQLQQEIHLHQAMSDILTHHLTPQQSKSSCPSAPALRCLHSLLGEGGTHFPALVLDSNTN